MFSKFDISLMVPGMSFDGDALVSAPLGGSESAGIYMAQALAARGASVNVFCNTTTGSTDAHGVAYSPLATWQNWVRTVPHDVCIAQRRFDAFGQRTNARLNILWCHDLALGRHAKVFAGMLWNVDRVFVVSEYMKSQYVEVLGADPKVLHVTRNGIDPSLFEAIHSIDGRDCKKLVFASRPERGLDVLLREVMPRLLQQDPEYRLFIAGYGNTQPEWQHFYAQCAQDAAALGDRVVNMGGLCKADLYRLYASAGACVYPTPSPRLPLFREVSCISAMECQAAGLPIVTTALGALTETIAPGAGVLLPNDPSCQGYVERFVESVLHITRDHVAWAAASAAGRKRAEDLAWSEVATEWLEEFERDGVL